MNRITHFGHDSYSGPVSADDLFEQIIPTSEAGDVEYEFHTSFDCESQVFVPSKYEPRYAYPLIVSLQSREESTDDFYCQMDQISSQNYLAVEIDSRQLREAPTTAELMQTIEAIVSRMGGYYHIHSERIFVMGRNEQANRAMDLVLSNPLKFSGFIAIDPQQQAAGRPLGQFRHLHHLRGLFQMHGPQSWIKDYGHLLHDAGIKVHINDVNSEMSVRCDEDREYKAARLIDRFIMQSILETYLTRS
ncbi:hypothetical protein [Rubinisphaera margarita]|uniref:hypothetical protein n=1 Tax=Rubinisphaera margarita TaxID=2909586 RepID=UPI001EE7B3B6|nr:hypothetical protein [Rubinisphaera margarita]MCG6156683.1 hypothetical protein [Rubinisphaera margarita]